MNDMFSIFGVKDPMAMQDSPPSVAPPAGPARGSQLVEPEKGPGGHWTLPVLEAVTGDAGQLFGGCGLAAALSMAEGLIDRRVVWATAQFLRPSVKGDRLKLSLIPLTTGRRFAQAQVVASIGHEPRQITSIALGSSDDPREVDATSCPDVPPPGACPAYTRPLIRGSILDRLSLRIAAGRNWHQLGSGDRRAGGACAWARLPDGIPMNAAALAVVGDTLFLAAQQLLGQNTRCLSLDNTLRVVRPAPGPWVLIDSRLDAVANGIASGTVRIWDEQATLLAIASQTAKLRSR